MSICKTIFVLRLCQATMVCMVQLLSLYTDRRPRSSACNAWTTYTLMVPCQHYTRHLNQWEADQPQCSQWWLYSPQQYCYKIRELREVRKVKTSCFMHHMCTNCLGLYCCILHINVDLLLNIMAQCSSLL